MNNKNKKLTIFMYHEVLDNPSKFCIDYNLNVKPRIFKKQIDWINQNYNIVNPQILLNTNLLPENAALITFDDGFRGAFENGLSYLESKSIPSVMFLNMGHIIDKTPLISSAAIYFSKHCKDSLLSHEKKSFYLKVTPSRFQSIQKEFTSFEKKCIQDYQGSLADVNVLTKWDKSNLVYFGNHLYEHYNSTSMTTDEFAFSYTLNMQKLSYFKNYINFFSFPNGKPNICFNNQYVDIIKSFNCKKIFFSEGSINTNINNDLLDRIDFSDYERNILKMNFRIFLSKLKSKYLISIFQKFRILF